MSSNAGHRLRVQGLQEQGGEAAGIHRRVGVHSGDGLARAKPARALFAPDLGGPLDGIGAGHLFAQREPEPALQKSSR